MLKRIYVNYPQNKTQISSAMSKTKKFFRLLFGAKRRKITTLVAYKLGTNTCIL